MDEKKSKSVPYKLDLYFLLHEAITETHKLEDPIYDGDVVMKSTAINNGYPRNQELGQERKNKISLARLVLFMCDFVYENNQENGINTMKYYEHLLRHCKLVQQFNLIPEMIAIISSYLTTESFQFNTKQMQGKRYNSQLNFNDTLDKVTFERATQDYLLLVNEVPIDLKRNDYHAINNTNIIRFDTFVLGKGDEMWIGIINECDLDQETFALEKFYGSWGNNKFDNAIVYYGERESTIRYGKEDDESICGEIVVNKKRIDKNVPIYRSFDWISIVVDYTKECIYFEKNKSLVASVQMESIIKDKNAENVRLYFICEVDHRVDGFYVQKYPLYEYNNQSSH